VEQRHIKSQLFSPVVRFVIGNQSMDFLARSEDQRYVLVQRCRADGAISRMRSRPADAAPPAQPTIIAI